MRRAAWWGIGLGVGAVAIAGTLLWNASQPDDPAWLFSQTAASGTLVENSDGGLTLTLQEFDPHVMAFTDRPVRDAEILEAAEFVQAWPALFAGSPPNAVLVEHEPQGEANSVVLTLGPPSLTPEGLEFPAKELSTEIPSGLSGMAESTYDLPPREFGQVSLFIDSSGLPCATGQTADCPVSPIEAGILRDLGYTVTGSP